MKPISKKIIASLVFICMSLFIFTSCILKSEKHGDSLVTQQTTKPITDAVSTEKITLTMFTTFPAGIAARFKTLNDCPNIQALEEVTNIKLDIIGVPESNYAERKNLLFASEDLPDIIYSNNAHDDVFKYGVNDNLIIPLDNLIEEHANNFNKWIDIEPAIKEQILASDGYIYHMPYVDMSLKNIIQLGYYVREAWLTQLNLEPPKTLDELYDFLKALKEADPAGGGNTIPLASSHFSYIVNPILGSYGTTNGIYRVYNKIKYGPIEPEFKEALKYLNILYKENLIPSDFLTYDAKTYNANLPNNIGLSFCYTNGGIRNPLLSAGLTEKEILDSWSPISGMKGPDGKFYWFITTIGSVTGAAGELISSSNKHIVETMKWIDYKYSKEGARIVSWGKKGVTWDFDANGIFYIKDLALKNPDGLEPTEVLLKNGLMQWVYTVCLSGLSRTKPTARWPFTLEDIDYNTTLFGPNPDSVYSRNLKNWWDFDASRQLPITIRYTSEEQENIGVLLQDIKTLVEENMNKIIMGLEPIEKWDEIVNQLKNMKVDEYIAIHQAALDRVK